MKLRALKWILIFSIPMTALIGITSVYLLNEIIHKANRTPLSLKEEVSLIDKVIEKAKKNEIDQSKLIKLFENQKNTRISSYKLMDSVEKIRNSVIVALIFACVTQLSLLFMYVKAINKN